MHSDTDVKDGSGFSHAPDHPNLVQTSLNITLAVKLTLLLSTIFYLQVSATAFSQQISLSVKNEPLEKVIQLLRKQSGYAFFYDAQYLQDAKPVTVKARETSIEKLLPAVFFGQPFTYEVIDKTIILRPIIDKPEPMQSTPALIPLDKNIRGVVKDSVGVGLPGVSVLIKGTTKGTITDNKGNYQLGNVPEDAVLRFSMIGFMMQEVPVNNQSSIDISLKEDNLNLQEVSIVSTGYQELPKERATGSFVQIDNKLLNRRVSTNLLDRLEGITPGLNFNRSSTGEPTISIRGQSTIYANSTPLIVLDGFPYDGDINSINPNDVENITILKDAAAASIWGVRAGNGVIVITTKKGKRNSPVQFEFNTNVTLGMKPDVSYLPKLSSESFIRMEQTMFDKGFYNALETNTVVRPSLSPVVETLILQRDGKLSSEQVNERINNWKGIDNRNDFEKYFLRNSVNQQYALSSRGGTELMHYFLSAGYDNNKDAYVGNGLQRVSLRAENTITPIKGLELTSGLMYVGTKTSANNKGLRFLNVQDGGVKSLYPYAELADNAGNPLPVSYIYRTTFIDGIEDKGLLNWQYKPLQELNAANNSSKEAYLRFHSGLLYQISQNLNLEVKYQFEKSQQGSRMLNTEESYFTRNIINQFTSINATGGMVRPAPLGSILDLINGNLLSHTGRGQLSYNNQWQGSLHGLSAIVGTEIKQASFENYASRLYGYDDEIIAAKPVDYINFYKLYYSSRDLTSQIPNGNRVISSTLNRFISYYANASYTFNNKYTISGSGRLDASNFFGVKSNQKVVPLWSTGLSWNIVKEKFCPQNIFNTLLLKATYGFNGNLDKTITAFTTTNRSFDIYTLLPSAKILNPPNPNLIWERIGIINIGLDFEAVNNRISGSLEWYHKSGKDLFGFRELDPTVGLIRYKGNVASIKARGLDIIINSKNTDGLFKWQTTLLLSRAVDKVTEMKFGGISALSYVQQTASLGINSINIVPLEGNAIYGLYSYRSAGLDPLTGDARGVVNGEATKDYALINSATKVSDLVYHGSSRPTAWGAVRNTFIWRNFTLSANISYKLGHKFRRSSVNYDNLFRNYVGHEDFDSRWQKPGDEKFTSVPSMPSVTNTSRDQFYLYSSDLISNASHIRFQDLQLNYRLKLSSQTGRIKSIDLYAYVNNLGIIWRANKFGIDPDYTPEPNSLYLPQPKTISVGLKTQF